MAQKEKKNGVWQEREVATFSRDLGLRRSQRIKGEKG
jgi:hypothetical protein